MNDATRFAIISFENGSNLFFRDKNFVQWKYTSNESNGTNNSKSNDKVTPTTTKQPIKDDL